MQEIEGIGVFYLGNPVDPVTHDKLDVPLLYESKDLLTHAVCVGMTGSGKTGLCIGLLEEAALDGIPAIVIDPKGDLANLLLTFPALNAEDFSPWINPDEARDHGLTPEQFAQKQADLWRSGLRASGQDETRIQRLKDAVECVVYTPGSEAGRSVSVLTSFAAPDQSMLDDEEAFRDRISTAATSLLGLIGIDADPIQSRELVLLSNILEKAWRAGQNPDLASLIGSIQKPPFNKVGVLELETFYPARERFLLAMALNNLIAAPGFQAWMEGEPLDIGGLLHSPAGKPKISIFSIAHLSDPERMFFVSLLLNQMLSWVRAQSGTTSLRALLYMDEIFGYFPPVANPPSKKPLLTLLKQSRAFGVGIVLATQNPVDLDYKGLSNTGTWFIGRLQTERDKMRVLEGLEGAAGEAHASFDRQRMGEILAGLEPRVFLLNNVHENAPILFHTRWTLSYLRGPLTLDQIRTLTRATRVVESTAPTSRRTDRSRALAGSTAPPVLPPEIPQYFLPVRSPAPVSYQPVIVGSATLRYLDDDRHIDITNEVLFTTPVCNASRTIDWSQATSVEASVNELEREPADGTQFEDLPLEAAKPKNYVIWSRSFVTWLLQSQTLDLLESPRLEQESMPGESERAFRIRLQQAAREERDRVAETLRQKYGARLAALDEQKRRAELQVEQQKAQKNEAMMQGAISVGTGLLGAFLGRKRTSSGIGQAATAARQMGRSWKESQDVALAAQNVEQIAERIFEMQKQFEAELQQQQSKLDPAIEELQRVTVRLKKSNITVNLVALGWSC